MKLIAMIPARLSSQRVKLKNLRKLREKPLVSYIIESALNSDAFEKVYINSEAEIFREIADMYGIEFYKRPDQLASNSATNDDFAYDFIKNVNPKILIQLLPTSPFLTPAEINNFINEMLQRDFETMISVKNVQIECLFNGKPLNFNQKDQTQPAQTLLPIQAYACSIMGWNCETYKRNMKEYGAAYHGGDGKIGYFTLTGYSTVDIDNEEDFKLAEAILLAKEQKMDQVQYHELDANKNLQVEIHVPSILKKDGVYINDLFNCNDEVVSIDDIIARNGKKNASWSKRVVNTENNSATIICQKPGEGNRQHYHENWNEWWYILDGKWEVEIDNRKRIVKKGDLVFLAKGRKHRIIVVGNEPAIRLAVSREDVAHIYEREKEI